MIISQKNCLRCLLLWPLLFLIACSGDARPLEESVESSNLNLVSMTVFPPQSMIASRVGDTGETQEFPLAVNVGTQIQFSINGINLAGEAFSVSTADRAWTVSNPEVATISNTGLLNTVGNGVVDVGVVIGGIDSTTYRVNVQNAQVQSLAGIYGEQTLEQCLAKPYTTLGVFSDGSTRVIDSVNWSVSNPDIAFTKNAQANTVDLVAVESGSIELMASTEGATSASKTIVVMDSLSEIIISPAEPRVRVGETREVRAQGIFRIDDEDETHDITDNLVWSLPEDNGIASVSNLVTSIGRVTGIKVGSVFLTARCGMDGVQQQVPVEVTLNPNWENLAFLQANPLNVSLSSGTQELAVSTGSTYNSNYDVSSTAFASVWEVTSGTNVVSLDQDSSGVVLTLLSVGDATVRVSYNGYSESISISVK